MQGKENQLKKGRRVCKYIVNCLSESRIIADDTDFADFGGASYQIYEKPLSKTPPAKTLRFPTSHAVFSV